jgi:hypothetical protein
MSRCLYLLVMVRAVLQALWPASVVLIELWAYWNMYIAVINLDSIHIPVIYLKHDVSVTGLCLCLQVEPIQ